MSRSAKKGPFVHEKLFRKVSKLNENRAKQPLKTWARACTIIPEFVGHTFEVHNGNKFIRVFIQEDMVATRLVSPEDLNLFRIVDSAEAAVAEIAGFYRNYHSCRFVKGQLVLRLQHLLTAEQVDRLNEQIAHLYPGGKLEQRSALPEEGDEPEWLDLPRLVVPYDRRSAGYLRQLIDLVNALPPAGPVPSPA